MITIKGKYDGIAVTLERSPVIDECDVIVTFLETPVLNDPSDDGSLAYLFKNYSDDGIRETIVDFGKAVGNEQW